MPTRHLARRTSKHRKRHPIVFRLSHTRRVALWVVAKKMPNYRFSGKNGRR